MMLLVESTWLALSIWVIEHGMLVGAVALACVQGRLALRREPATA